MKPSLHRAGIMLCALVVFAGCGGGDSQDAAGTLDKLQQQAEGLKKAAETMNETMQQQREPVPPVSFRVLLGFLPSSLAGLTPEEPEGETASMGEWQFSKASIKFKSSDRSQSADVQIFDYAFIQAMYVPYQMMLKMGYNRESTKGYERATTIAGYTAFEKWELDVKHHQVTVLVADRFVVICNTRGLDEGTASKTIEAMNLKELASQKAS
jgi:hypothetical protein